MIREETLHAMSGEHDRMDSLVSTLEYRVSRSSAVLAILCYEEIEVIGEKLTGSCVSRRNLREIR